MRFWLPIWWAWKGKAPEFVDTLLDAWRALVIVACALVLVPWAVIDFLLVTPVRAPLRYLKAYWLDARDVAEGIRTIRSPATPMPMAKELLRRRRLVFPRSRLYRTLEKVWRRRERRFNEQLRREREALGMGQD